MTNSRKHIYIDTLAAAYAEIRDFESAAKWEKKAISLLPKDDSEHEGKFKARLKLYKSGKPYRVTP